MNATREKVLAALTTLGSGKPKAIGKEAGEPAGTAGYHLAALVKEGKAAKKAGLYSLPGSPPPSTTPRKNGKTPSARAAGGSECTFAMTDDTRLVILGPMFPAPLLLTEKQTERLATLMQAHFEDPK